MAGFPSTIRRIWWQVFGALAINFPFIERLSFSWCPAPVLNCYACPLAQTACPMGSLQHFLVIGSLPFFVFGVTAAFGMIAGRFYCSHLCPFGFVQDLLARIPAKKLRIPAAFGWGKYVSLVVLALILPPILKEPFFCTLCPAGSLEAGIPIVTQAWAESKFGAVDSFGASFGVLGMVGWWFWFKISILLAVIAAAVFIRRPFCRMACPLGAILGLFNRISLFVHPKPAEDGRIRLNLRNCPVGIVHPGNVDSHHCIKCRECFAVTQKIQKTPSV
jgi:polyferredoxin